MRLRGRQGRFVAVLLTGWVAGRGTILWWGMAAVVGLGMLAKIGPMLEPPRPVVRLPFRPVHARPLPPPAASAAPRPMTGWSPRPAWMTPERAPEMVHLAIARLSPGSIQAALRRATFARPADSPLPVVEPPATPILMPAEKRGSRWTASAYLFFRPGGRQAALAAAGELGGSQAAARITYRLNRDGPVHTALAARLYAPVGAKGAETALGLDWHPLPAIPLRLSVERRQALDDAGRSAWSAYAAGGFYAERFGRQLVVDGYGQGGVVGARRRDLFVDGALRAGTPIAVAPAVRSLIGGAVWGAAQPGVARLDIGPRASLSIPVHGGAITAALEGRLRIAGRAAPGSGAALTLAADF